jgi:hypothetical protein
MDDRRTATERAAQVFEAAWADCRAQGWAPWRDSAEVHEAAASLIEASGEDNIREAYMLLGRPGPWMTDEGTQ